MTTTTYRHGESAQELHPEESWGFLADHELGRLAFHLADEVHIVPINYVAEDRRLLFLTAEGSKLLGLTMNADVAFEVDEITGEQATSVIVRGRARQLVGSAAWVADRLPLRPWVDTPKYIVVEIVADEVTGRRFDLHRPWLTARVGD
ncbi:MAG: pyridoxamine 5-phosphate oxidase-related FMN-binding protein [Humibacillus sp.]|nr:pyridoxamine 5-phosphate oxidase-related FMN-binding protein [Humibacillus sp.]